MVAQVPVLQVPVDDSQWQAFLATFGKFREDAADVPRALEDVERVVNRLPEHLRPGAEAMEEAAQGAAEALDGAASVAGGGGSGGGKKRGGKSSQASTLGPMLDWVAVGAGAKRFASTITAATRDLARWEKLTATFAALLGAGGLYGLDVLAAGAARRRQESAGYAMSAGELASFRTNYGRLGDVGGVLEGLAGAQTDFAKRQPLQSLGVDPRGKTSLAIFGEILPKLKAIADHADPRGLGQEVRARGLDKIGIGVEMMRLIRSLPAEEIEQMRANAGRDAAALGVPDDVGRKWQELDTALHKAETQFATVIAGRLVALTPGLTHLSETAVKLFDHLLARPEVKILLKRVDDALLGFADDIGSKKAQEDVKAFLHRFDMARSDFDALNRWVENHPVLLGALAAGFAAIPFGPAAVAAAMVGGAMAAGSTVHDQTMRRQYDDGAAAERPTLEQRNAERRGLGLPEYKDQAAYDAAEPVARQGADAAAPPHDASTEKLAAAAVDIASTKEGETQYNERDRQDIEQYLRTGGRGMDPARVAWCAAFVGASLRKAGLKNSGSDLARSYAHWGAPVGTKDAIRGDVMMEGSDLHHVGMATGRHEVRGGVGYTEMISGNYGHAVHTRWFRDSNMTTRRATAAERLQPEAPKAVERPPSARETVPKEMRDRTAFRRQAQRYLAGHPDARPKPPQSVRVVDNSGGEHTVTVAH